MYLLILAAMGLRYCARAFSSCGKRGLLFIAVRGLLIVVASLVAEHGLQVRGFQQLQHADSVVAARRLSSCGTRAYLLRVMWDPPRPGLEPVSPALAGGFPTTAPPRKSLTSYPLNKYKSARALPARALPGRKCYQQAKPGPQMSFVWLLLFK